MEQSNDDASSDGDAPPVQATHPIPVRSRTVRRRSREPGIPGAAPGDRDASGSAAGSPSATDERTGQSRPKGPSRAPTHQFTLKTNQCRRLWDGVTSTTQRFAPRGVNLFARNVSTFCMLAREHDDAYAYARLVRIDEQLDALEGYVVTNLSRIEGMIEADRKRGMDFIAGSMRNFTVTQHDLLFGSPYSYAMVRALGGFDELCFMAVSARDYALIFEEEMRDILREGSTAVRRVLGLATPGLSKNVTRKAMLEGEPFALEQIEKYGALDEELLQGHIVPLRLGTKPRRPLKDA